MARRSAHRTSRRTVLSGALSTLAAAAVWGAARAQNRQLLIYSWYTIPVEAIIKDFVAETKADVKYIGSYSGNPVWWSKMIAGEVWDVFLPSMDWMTRAALAGRLEPLDFKRIPNVKYLSATGQRVVADELTVNGQVYALPWTLTINALVYNRNVIDKSRASASWDVMWDPALAGKLTTKDEAIIPILTAAARLDIDSANIGSWSPAQIDAIRKSLLEQKKLIRKYWSNHEEVAEMLATGQSVAAVWTDARARHLAFKGQPVELTVPAQGAPAVIDAISIRKDGPNKDLAHEFVNFALRPEQMVKISNLHGAAVMNDAAHALIPDDRRASFVVDPSWTYRWRRFLAPDVAQRVERLWTEVKLAKV